MLKRTEFILGAAVGLAFAAVATAGGVIDWPTANAEPVAGASGRLTASAGAAGLAFAPPQGAPLSFADIFDQVSPAVVQIDVETRIARPRGGIFTIPGLPGFGFQAPETEAPEGEDAPTALGAGSGFFISADGFIVTNNHVVANAEEITVKLSDGRELNARLVGRDEDTDLAVIKVEGGNFPFVSFEESAEPRVGDWVIAVGNPFGLGGTATAGIVSAKARDIGGAENPYTDFLQIDAAINRGNSGGPTFDIYGRVIGVNSAIFSPTGGSVGIGFAIPASIAKSITDQLMRGESIERGYLGVSISTPGPEELESVGAPAGAKGALVANVTPGGPADEAGLRFSDLVVSMDGRAVESSTELTRRVAGIRPGQMIRLEILRDGRRQTINVRSGTRPSQEQLNAQNNDSAAPGTPQSGPVAGVAVAGLNVMPMSAALRRQYGIPDAVDGLVVTGRAQGGDQRFRPGFVIRQAGSVRLRSVAEFEAAVEAARRAGRGSIRLLVWAGGDGSVPVVLELPKAAEN